MGHTKLSEKLSIDKIGPPDVVMPDFFNQKAALFRSLRKSCKGKNKKDCKYIFDMVRQLRDLGLGFGLDNNTIAAVIDMIRKFMECGPFANINEQKLADIAVDACIHAIADYDSLKGDKHVIARRNGPDKKERAAKYVLAYAFAKMRLAVTGNELTETDDDKSVSMEEMQSAVSKQFQSAPEKPKKQYKIQLPAIVKRDLSLQEIQKIEETVHSTKLISGSYVERLKVLDTRYLKENRFRLMREGAGLSVLGLSKKPNLPSISTLRSLEHRFSPQVVTSTVAKVARFHRVSPDFILGLTNDHGIRCGTMADKRICEYLFQTLAVEYDLNTLDLYEGLGIDRNMFRPNSWQKEMIIGSMVSFSQFSGLPIANMMEHCL